MFVIVSINVLLYWQSGRASSNEKFGLNTKYTQAVQKHSPPAITGLNPLMQPHGNLDQSLLQPYHSHHKRYRRDCTPFHRADTNAAISFMSSTPKYVSWKKSLICQMKGGN